MIQKCDKGSETISTFLSNMIGNRDSANKRVNFHFPYQLRFDDWRQLLMVIRNQLRSIPIITITFLIKWHPINAVDFLVKWDKKSTLNDNPNDFHFSYQSKLTIKLENKAMTAIDSWSNEIGNHLKWDIINSIISKISHCSHFFMNASS